VTGKPEVEFGTCENDSSKVKKRGERYRTARS